MARKHQAVKYRSSRLEQLCSIADLGPTWDGSLISKTAAAGLAKAGLIHRAEGWSILSTKGLRYLLELGLLVS